MTGPVTPRVGWINQPGDRRPTQLGFELPFDTEEIAA